MNKKLVTISLVCLLLVVGVILVAGKSPIEVLNQIFKGSLGSPRAIGGTLKEATPLLIAGLGVFIALRAGLFNIGVEGQLLAGALVAVVVGLAVPGPFGIVLGTLAAAAIGALLAWPAVAIRVYRGGHEVITTIMLNSIVKLVTAALVAGPLKSKEFQDPRTAELAKNTHLPPIIKSGMFELHISLVIGVVIVIAFGYWLKRSIAGFELRAVGENRKAAQFAGIDSNRVMIRSFLVSGALAGLAGAMMIFAHEHQFFDGFSPGYGFDALGVALLAGSSPFALLPAAIGFGILNQGQSALSQIGISKGLTSILLGALIIVMAAFRYRSVSSGGKD